MALPGESLVVVRSRPLRTLGLVFVACSLGFGAWWLVRGKGQPEDPARVLIIGPAPELEAWLDEAGFDAEHSTFGAAIGEGKSHDSSLDDVAAVIEHADQRGIGYVAFDLSRGQTYDFAGAGYDLSVPSGATVAVLAVGRLGEHASFGTIVPEVEHRSPADEHVGLLLGLFGQPELAKVRSGNGLNDLMIRFGAASTMEDVVEIERGQAEMRSQLAAWQSVGDGERGDRKPLVLGRPFEALEGWVLADGSLMIASHGGWYTTDGITTHVETEAGTTALASIDLETPLERTPCTGLPESLHLDLSVGLSPAGDAIATANSRWVADTWLATDASSCAFAAGPPIRRLARGELGRLGHAGSRTAEVIDGNLNWAEAKRESNELLSMPDLTLRDWTLAWLSTDVAIMAGTLESVATDLANLPEPREVLMLARLGTRTEIAIVSTPAGRSARAITTTPGFAPGTAVLALVGGEGIELTRVSVAMDAIAWTDPRALEFDPATTVDQTRTVFATLATVAADVRDLAISPAGTGAAWAASFDGGPDEIVVLAFGGEPWRLTNNEILDQAPRFAGKSHEWVVFESSLQPVRDLPAVTTLRTVPID